MNAVLFYGVVCAYKKYSQMRAFPLKKMSMSLTALSFWKALCGMGKMHNTDIEVLKKEIEEREKAYI